MNWGLTIIKIQKKLLRQNYSRRSIARRLRTKFRRFTRRSFWKLRQYKRRNLLIYSQLNNSSRSYLYIRNAIYFPDAQSFFNFLILTSQSFLKLTKMQFRFFFELSRSLIQPSLVLFSFMPARFFSLDFTFLTNPNYFQRLHSTNQIIKFKKLSPLSTYLPYITFVINKYTTFLANAPVLFFFTSKTMTFLKTNDLLLIISFFNKTRTQAEPFLGVFRQLDFYSLTLYAFYWLDFNWLLRRIQLILDKIDIFRHKRFWVYFFKLVYRHIFIPLSGTRIAGIHISIKGKIGVVGNSRKRRLFVKYGNSSVSRFSRKIYVTDNQFLTPTGAIGFKTWVLFVDK